MSHQPASPLRHLVIVLGDQLDLNSAAFDGFDPELDAIWMAEVAEESTHVWTHKARIALFLTAMRHFRDTLRNRDWPMIYRELGETGNRGSFSAEIRDVVKRRRPVKLLLVEPGELRVKQAFEDVAQAIQVKLELRPDRHFLCSREQFAAHAEGRKTLRMEYFYRQMRRQIGVLVDDGKPVGAQWNFDAENRETFGREGPEQLPLPPSFSPDRVTRDVIRLVDQEFASHPGRLDAFDWPVTRDQAQLALQDFVSGRLPSFGRFQDAMWSGEPFLYHALLSSALNLKLLDPREVIDSALDALQAGDAPLAAVEGFVRQILGWREYVRGVYWRYMPEYEQRNFLNAELALPQFYWTGETDMNCLREVITQTLDYGYAHHIQRLMVTGLFALLAGVDPRALHRWYLAVYVDAVEWVELPNTLGMSQFADGGIMASKPYVASGKYIARMSNYCTGCRYDPADACGERACPYTTLYWDFLQRHRKVLERNHRMKLQVRNLARKSAGELRTIRQRARTIRSEVT